MDVQRPVTALIPGWTRISLPFGFVVISWHENGPVAFESRFGRDLAVLERRDGQEGLDRRAGGVLGGDGPVKEGGVRGGAVVGDEGVLLVLPLGDAVDEELVVVM